MINIDILKRLEGESENQYVWRLGSLKDEGVIDLDWEELCDVFNRNLLSDECDYKCSSAYRKPYQYAKKYYIDVFSKEAKESKPYICFTEDQKYIAEKVRLRDERNELSRLMRDATRQETFIELVRDAFVKDVKPFGPHDKKKEYGENAAVIHLTDIHTGIQIKNSKNVYNEDVLYERLDKYLGEVRNIIELHNVVDCHIVLGGDLVSGIIHPNLRLENNLNVIEQVKMACTLVSMFVDEVSGMCRNVYVHSVSGNHSRISPSKEQHLNGEELDALVPFYLTASFNGREDVFIDNDVTYGDYVTVFDVLGHTFVGMHGDKDVPNKVAMNATKIIGSMPDVVMIGHRHTNGLVTSDCGVKVVQSGCISGVDNYAYDHRLFSDPEQMVVVVSEDKAIECLYDVSLK